MENIGLVIVDLATKKLDVGTEVLSGGTANLDPVTSTLNIATKVLAFVTANLDTPTEVLDIGTKKLDGVTVNLDLATVEISLRTFLTIFLSSQRRLCVHKHHFVPRPVYALPVQRIRTCAQQSSTFAALTVKAIIVLAANKLACSLPKSLCASVLN